MWVARRSMSKPNWPGKLDHIAAGGQVCIACDVYNSCICLVLAGATSGGALAGGGCHLHAAALSLACGSHDQIGYL